jgi:hypothetical protein
MRFGVGIVLAVACTISIACGGSALFKQYEYEEDLYLSLDGSATVYVNGSIAALDALRGAPFDASADARFDRAKVRAFFTTPETRVVSLSTSRRAGRRFAHVRVDVTDVRRLSEAAPFAWSSYRFSLADDHYAYRQILGPPAGSVPAGVHWTGRERVAFRLHLPSNILEHNAGEANHRRGNILVWEQTLSDRLAGKPLTMSADIGTESILANALWIFAASIAAAAAAFAGAVWWIMRRGTPAPHRA